MFHHVKGIIHVKVRLTADSSPQKIGAMAGMTNLKTTNKNPILYI